MGSAAFPLRVLPLTIISVLQFNLIHCHCANRELRLLYRYACSRSARGNRSGRNRSGKRWVASVKTVSTFHPPGLFKKGAPVIAKSLASRKVSPKDTQSGMRMLNYYINRAGRNLSPSRRRELNKAKTLLSKRITAHKTHKLPSNPARKTM